MDLTQYVLLAAVIAGVNEFIKRLRAKDFWVALTIATSALIGMLFGAAGVENLGIITGIAAGFGLSGAMSTLSMFGNKSAATPSSAVQK